MARTKWTPELEARLSELAGFGLTATEAAIVMGLTPGAVQGRASKLELSFNSAPLTGLRRFLQEGGSLVREDIGGVVGVRWAPAHRCGSAFETEACERFLELGLLTQREPPRPVYSMASH